MQGPAHFLPVFGDLHPTRGLSQLTDERHKSFGRPEVLDQILYDRTRMGKAYRSYGVTMHSASNSASRRRPRPPPWITAHASAACISRATDPDVGPSSSADPLNVYQACQNATDPGSTLSSAWTTVRALEEESKARYKAAFVSSWGRGRTRIFCCCLPFCRIAARLECADI